MFKTLLKQIGDYKKDAILTPVFVVLEVIMEVIIPIMMAAIIDYGLADQSIGRVVMIGLAMIGAAMLALWFGVESGRTASSASSGFAMNLRQAMYERIQTFSFSNIDKFSTAGLVTRMTTDVMNVQQAFQMSIRICVRAPIMLVSAMVMTCLSIFGGRMTLGTLASFLQFSRSFNQPISQLSQQLNSIIMAIAGAERIFGLLDEEPEQDGGYVKLVNARYDARGNLTEVPERTGIWAWKHYHKADDTTTYQLLKGDVVFDHVDFGYTEDKEILHDIEIFARPGQKVAIARVAVADPPVLILDEATSSIDTRTEKIVQDGMDRLMKGRTVFVIAHRLSTIKNSDVIMVLDHGRIVERGNHESLLAKKGMYYQLYTGKLEQE